MPRRSRSPAGARPRENERGVVGGIEAIPFGLLIFVSGALLIANAWAVVDAKMATDSASREAVRYLVESNGDTTGALAIGNEAFQNHVGHTDRLITDVVVQGSDIGGGFARCARVAVTYQYTTRAVSVPLLGGWGSGITVTSTHSEIVDPYRAGLGEDSLC